MKDFFKNTFIFLLGTSVGSFAMWSYIRKKYSCGFAFQESVDDIIEDILYGEDETPEGIMTKINSNYGGKPLNEMNVVTDNNEKITVKMELDKPYIITPGEFGEFHDYETITLIYYSDGVLVDDNDEIIDEPDEIVGEGNLERFGEFDDNSLHIRNDQLKCDYEILKDKTTYSNSCFNNELRRES